MQNGCWKIVDIETMLTIDENHDLNDSISDIQAGPSMMCFFRALYMGELRKNTTSTGTITKKNQVTLEILRLLAQKKFFMR